MAIDTLLHGAKGCAVFFFLVLKQDEGGPELGMQLIGTVAHDRQATALCRAVFVKGGNDDLSARLDRTQDGFNVGLPFGRCSQEVEDCLVVPYVIGMDRKRSSRDVCFHPLHAGSTRVQAPLCGRERRRRQVEHGQCRISVEQEIIHQCGCSATNIHDGR